VPGRALFGQDRRVRKRREFNDIQSNARRVTSPHFTFLVAVRRDPEPGVGEDEGSGARPARLGLIVTKKIGGAVVRNRVKRLCRECFRQWPGLVPAEIDLVVVARNGCQTLGLAEVRAEWEAISRLLRRRAEEALAGRRRGAHLSLRPRES
jgi:ribonuclease P protein component